MTEIQLHLGDCLDILPTLESGSVDAVITDPPYPDYHTDLYQQVSIDFLDTWVCRQFVFWSARHPFPLDYTGRHVWDKVNGIGTQYEYIYERNGSTAYRCLRHISPSSSVRAQIGGDVKVDHPSQKPIKLMIELMTKYTNPGATILDPFMGSGTTGVACVKAGRNFIGIEIDPDYFEIAERRIAEAQMQPRLEGI